MTLSEIEAAGWAALQQAAADPHAGFRTVTLCSIDAAAAPQARMVVLRAGGCWKSIPISAARNGQS